MTKKIINHKSWYHAIQKCFSPTSDALNNEFKKKYSVEDYFNSVLKNKLWGLKHEILIFPVFNHHVSTKCQKCTRFFVKDISIATMFNRDFYTNYTNCSDSLFEGRVF